MLRSLSVCMLACATFFLGPQDNAAATSYPDRPIRIVVPYSAGGPTDVLARLVSQRLGEALGQQVVIENRPGGSGVIGMEQVARAQPDGYTILINASLHVIVPSLIANLKVDPINDFAAVSQFGTVPLIMVARKSLPVNSVSELIAMAKAQPGKLTYASSGIGASSHLAGAMLAKMTDTKMVHVPYKGSAPALTDVVGGHVDFMIDTTPASIAHVRNDTVKLLATSAPQRLSILPDVPTIAESVPGYNVQSWYGVWMPRGTPEDRIRKIQEEVAKILSEPDMQKRFREIGAEPIFSTPEEFDAFARSELTRWGEVVRESGAKLE